MLPVLKRWVEHINVKLGKKQMLFPPSLQSFLKGNSCDKCRIRKVQVELKEESIIPASKLVLTKNCGRRSAQRDIFHNIVEKDSLRVLDDANFHSLENFFATTASQDDVPPNSEVMVKLIFWQKLLSLDALPNVFKS